MLTDYEKIKELRKKMGFTQEALAKATGISAGAIKNIETARLKLSMENAEKLAEVLNVSPNVFFTKNTKVISGMIHKGGAGKTSVIGSLAATLATMGYSILCIDTDMQMNLTRSFGLESNEKNFYRAFTRNEDIQKHIIKTKYENIDFVVSDIALATIEAEINSFRFKEERMKSILHNLLQEAIYDFILIDTNPTLGSLNTSILNATHEVLIPVETSAFGVEGLGVFLNYFNEIKSHNTDLNILGIVFNKVDMREGITKDIMEVVKEVFGELTFENYISIDTNIKQAQWENTPLPFYSKNSRGTQQFKKLAKEVLRIVQEH